MLAILYIYESYVLNDKFLKMFDTSEILKIV